MRTSEPSAGKTKPSATPSRPAPARRLRGHRGRLPGNEDRAAPRARDDRRLRGAPALVAAAASARRSGAVRGASGTRPHYPDLARRCAGDFENENRFQLWSAAWQTSSLPDGVRPTSQRLAVARAVAESAGSFTVAELHDRARRFEPRLGLATTYRTVELLRASGGVRPLLGDGRPTYVRCHAEHHHHLVCTSCGVEEQSSAPPSEAELERRHGFRPAAHELDIYGICGAARSWIAIPLAGITVTLHARGGHRGAAARARPHAVIALTGESRRRRRPLPGAAGGDRGGRRPSPGRAAGRRRLVFFFVAERALVLHHRDDDAHVHAHAQVGALGAAGLSVHSFIDGLGIGLAFGLSTETGLLVFVAVLAHDFADGLNTVGFVLRQSGDRARAIRWLAIDAAAPLAGAIVGSALTISEEASARSWRSMRASSCSWARPTCYRTRTSIRR